MVGLDTRITSLRGLNTAINSIGPQTYAAPAQGGGGPVEPVTYLPTSVGTPALAVGVRRLVEGYSGPLFRANRSDLSTLDINGDAVANYAALDAFAGGDTPQISPWYDQSGNNRPLAPAALLNAPIMDDWQTWDVHRAVNLDSVATFTVKELISPTGWNLSDRSYSIFAVVDPKAALASDYWWEFSSNAPAPLSSVFTRSSTPAKSVRTQYNVFGVVSGASNRKYFQDDALTAQGAYAAGTIDTFRLGDQSTATSSQSQNCYLAIVVYPTALSDANAQLVIDTLKSMFSVPDYSEITDQVIIVGDSIAYGLQSQFSQKNRNTFRALNKNLPKTCAMLNFGNPSQLFTTGIQPNSASREFAAVDTTKRYRILVDQSGTNDLGTNGATAGYGATLYAAKADYYAAAKAAGFTHVIAATLSARGDANWATQSTQRWIEMLDYNARVKSNSGGADRIALVDEVPGMGFADVNDTTKFQDKLHPTGLGYELLEPAYRTQILSILSS